MTPRKSVSGTPCGWRDANDRKLGVPIGYGHLLLVPFGGARGGRTQKFAGAPEKGAFMLPTGIYMYGSAQPLSTPVLSSREHMQRVVSFSRSVVPLELLGQRVIPVGQATLLLNDTLRRMSHVTTLGGPIGILKTVK